MWPSPITSTEVAPSDSYFLISLDPHPFYAYHVHPQPYFIYDCLEPPSPMGNTGFSLDSFAMERDQATGIWTQRCRQIPCSKFPGVLPLSSYISFGAQFQKCCLKYPPPNCCPPPWELVIYLLSLSQTPLLASSLLSTYTLITGALTRLSVSTLIHSPLPQ